MRPGALPTRNLPKKSHDSVDVKEGQLINIVQEGQSDTRRVTHQNIASLRHGLKTANLADWQLSEENELIYLNFSDPSFAVPKYSVIIKENFCFTIAIFNWKLPITHSIYGDNERSLKHLEISLLLSRILESQICHGISNYNAAESAIIHAIPKTLSSTSDSQFECTIYKRAQTCKVLLDVLTERFNQDNVEEYFGKQRPMGRRSDNPNMHQFGYNANAIRIQRSICVTTGNISGKYSRLKKKKSWVNVDMEPLAKRRESSN